MASAAPPKQSACELEELQATAGDLQGTALQRQQEVVAARSSTADLGAQVVLVAAYGRRLARLAGLLRQYDSHLQQALAALGLGQHQEQQKQEQGEDPGRTALAAAGLADCLRQVGEELAAAAEAAAARDTMSPDALLELGGSCAPAAARLAAAGAGAILAVLQEAIQADLAAVNGWPGAPQHSTADGTAAASPLGPAFSKQQRQQLEQWQAQAARQQQLDQLRSQVAAAQAALASRASSDGSGEAAAAAERTLLAAQQAGLRAELACLEAAKGKLQDAAAAAAQRVRQVEGGRSQVAALQEQEGQLDSTVRALCAADSRVMRDWRQGCWAAEQAVEAGVLAQRQPLVQLGQQLLDAQRRELAGFRGLGAAGSAAAASSGASASHSAAGSGAQPGLAAAAAQLLDPLAHLKTQAHAATLLAAATDEVQQLQPVARQWAELGRATSSELAGLQQKAEQLQREVQALLGGEGEEAEGAAAGAMRQLREAAAAAEEGMALLGPIRLALTEWWTSPAVTAAPWVKQEGRSAEEWLRILGEQQRAMQQRAAFTGRDASNRARSAMAVA